MRQDMMKDEGHRKHGGVETVRQHPTTVTDL
jgi:hypothetical protein